MLSVDVDVKGMLPIQVKWQCIACAVRRSLVRRLVPFSRAVAVQVLPLAALQLWHVAPPGQYHAAAEAKQFRFMHLDACAWKLPRWPHRAAVASKVPSPDPSRIYVFGID